MKQTSNVVLIGMPGAGKSTVGVLLAKRLSLEFLDTDVAIQRREGRTLQEIVDRDGADALRAIEEAYIANLECAATVIATGGSVVYSETAMRNLRDHGTIVFLDVPLAEIERRIANLDTRGLVRRRDQTLRDLYAERLPLYRGWADVHVSGAAEPQERVLGLIVRGLEELGR